MDLIKEYSRRLASPKIAFYTLIWLMVILVAGTVAQKYQGLYLSQKIFFSSMLVWVGPIPLPGGYLTLFILSLNLAAKILFQSPWKKERAGTLISHCGVLMLLAGGLLTAFFSSEGSMVIYEGESSNFVSDYHNRELVVFEAAADGSEKIHAKYDFDDIEAGQVLAYKDAPFSIEVIKSCRNCGIFQRKADPKSLEFKELKGRAREIDFEKIAQERDDEVNKSGVMFRLKGADKEQDGVYISFDFIPVSPHVEVDGKIYSIMLRKEKRLLPFSVKLVKFQKEFHPSTEIAKSYRSDVIVSDGGAEWKSVIQMNEPLHYRGYILYQSSFIDDNGKQATVLAVVKNLGRMFPYISGIFMCVGLLLHLVMQLPRLTTKRSL